MSLAPARWLAFLAVAFLAMTASAATPPAKPVDVTAESLEVFQAKSQAVFSGNVIATQGDMKLRADRMIVHYRPQSGGKKNTAESPLNPQGMASSISTIETLGHVFLSTPAETAQGNAGVYDLEHKLLTLNDQVVLTRGQNVIKGSKLTYDLASGKSSVVAGDGTGKTGKPGRVRALFVPEKGQRLPGASGDSR